MSKIDEPIGDSVPEGPAGDMVRFARSLTPKGVATTLAACGLLMAVSGIWNLLTTSGSRTGPAIFCACGIAWLLVGTTLRLTERRRAAAPPEKRMRAVWGLMGATFVIGPLATAAHLQPETTAGLLGIVCAGPTLGIAVVLSSLLLQQALGPERADTPHERPPEDSAGA